MAIATPETPDPLTTDADDRRIIRVLQAQPRASLAAVANILGLSEPTVSRRYARLRRLGVVRVTGIVDAGALGQGQWIVRLRCRPGSASAIADALAARDDIAWVALTSGGAEISCALRSLSSRERDDLLGHRLPRATAVLGLETMAILHKFLGGRARHWSALGGVLTAPEETALGVGGVDDAPFDSGPVVAAHPTVLEPEDEKVLEVLARDGRASLVDLGAAAGLTTGRASRRLDALLERRVVHLHVELAAAAIGLPTAANVWLRVRPAQLRSVGAALGALPEVGFAAAMSGRENLFVQVHCRDLDHVFALTSDRIGRLRGVESAEVDLVHRLVKQAGSLVDGDRLVS